MKGPGRWGAEGGMNLLLLPLLLLRASELLHLHTCNERNAQHELLPLPKNRSLLLLLALACSAPLPFPCSSSPHPLFLATSSKRRRRRRKSININKIEESPGFPTVIKCPISSLTHLCRWWWRSSPVLREVTCGGDGLGEEGRGRREGILGGLR